jgi:DNA-binding GntR family transcriptional regulator
VPGPADDRGDPVSRTASRLSTADIYRELREQICLLDIEPGSRLTEEGLAKIFGVSRTPIRQVLDRLEFERLVDQDRGSGARVAVLDSRELRDVWAVRLKVAELVGDFITVPARVHLVDQLRAIRDELDEVGADRDLRRLGQLYNRFHDTFLELLSNRTLKWMYDVLYHQTAREWLQFLPEMDLDAELEMMREELDRTIEAMQEPDGDRLAELRAKYMRLLLNRFNDHLRGPS